MRVRTLEIRWHDSKPISTCDFQPVAFKKARPAQDKQFVGQTYKLASGGEDNHVRLWMVHPNIMPPSILDGTGAEGTTPRPPRVEYLATLSRHSAAVNVVRWSPNGELIASAGDDGMVIIWTATNSPHTAAYGSDLTPEDMQYEKEHWKPRTTFRCTTMQVYDLAWSPNGEYIIAGSTDNCARIFTVNEGKCVHEIAEHNHYVQGVAWDPLNEYIATQSSDRSMHIYSISYKSGVLEVHAVGKNTKMMHRHSHSHSRTPSRPSLIRRESATSEAESSSAVDTREDSVPSSSQGALLTPTASVPSTPSMTMFPPSMERSSSRRSSFSGSNAPSSPATHTRYARSPSPMPALPAIRMPTMPTATATWSSIKLYGDESYTNFFRRLTFSPDGALLLTPAGQFEDPSVLPKSNDEQPSRGRKGNPSASENQTATSSVYIYSRANFARTPIARLPGHKKASVAVKFSPILYDLRSGVSDGEQVTEPKTVTVERGVDKTVEVDIVDPKPRQPDTPEVPGSFSTKLGLTVSPIISPSPRVAMPPTPQSMTMPSPALSAVDSLRPSTPAMSKSVTPAPPSSSLTSSVFALPYRMLYAVATMDTITIYDTQQAGPICLLTKLHYDEFTDMSWSPDGQSLILSSRDGYCTIVVFDDILPAYHTQQQTLQLQSIAHHHSVPLAIATPMSTPSINSVSLPTLSPTVAPVVPMKRGAEAPLTPTASIDDNISLLSSTDDATPKRPASSSGSAQEPPKKKRRAALTRVGDVGS